MVKLQLSVDVIVTVLDLDSDVFVEDTVDVVCDLADGGTDIDTCTGCEFSKFSHPTGL
ncbi:unnamed protein product [Schistosoma margrebowiei]|uniref:Uncharacterized protein n=1 Tax=Schistosoma margrebowiei TaxID=48269 RepID=A0A3P8A5G4_9TREM|nr:unnamed protein product [Schistosoma margrebowiei]